MNKEISKVLFICSYNAGRPQMAEGYLNTRYGDRHNARSAGFRSSRINPTTINVMAEIGIDIRTEYSEGLIEFKDETFDIIVILTDSPGVHALPLPEATTRVHKSFTDPGSFHGDSKAAPEGFRIVRDEITQWIDKDFVQGKIN